MKILVDTHIFLWIFIEPHRFSKEAKRFCKNVEANEFFISDASAWEASIKYGLGKLKLPEVPEYFIPNRIRLSGYHALPIDLEHVTKVHLLRKIHRDPFDRLLISQATIENMTILSEDRTFKKYGIKTLTLKDIS